MIKRMMRPFINCQRGIVSGGRQPIDVVFAGKEWIPDICITMKGADRLRSDLQLTFQGEIAGWIEGEMPSKLQTGRSPDVFEATHGRVECPNASP